MVLAAARLSSTERVPSVTANMLSSFKAEAKQQVAQEAANDPNSNFSAADAERLMVDESKKAGAPAFQFDPNATPAEKAAQAKAVRLCYLTRVDQR